MRKPNIQSPAIMAGTQNLENTAAVYGQQNDDNDQESKSNNLSHESDQQADPAPVKEDFLRFVPLVAFGHLPNKYSHLV